MSSGTSSGLRAANRASVLAALVRAGELSRAELVERCELSAATVAVVVADLIRDGYVEERGRVPSRGGRPIARLGVCPGGAYLLGAEVGDEDVTVELVDLALRRVDDERAPIGAADPSPVQVAAALRRALRAVRARNPAAEPRLLGLGLALPGSLGAPPASARARAAGLQAGAAEAAETLLQVPGLGWSPIRLGDLIGDVPAGSVGGRGLPLHPAGRAAALATAEAWHGAAPVPGRTLVVSLGRDVGLAVVDDGRLAPGQAGVGELGHTSVVPNGRVCRCGRRGCLVAYVGADALVEAWRTRGGAAPDPDGGAGTGTAAVAALVAAADDGETAAVTALDLALDLFAIALGNTVTLTGAGAVVVGGWAGDVLVRARGGALAVRVREATALPGAGLLSVTGCRAPHAGAFGAALLVLDELLGSSGLARESPETSSGV